MSATVVEMSSRKLMRQYKNKSYSIIRDGQTGHYKASLVVPLRPAKFTKNDFSTKVEAERWIREVIDSIT
jgi:hypothetical protein